MVIIVGTSHTIQTTDPELQPFLEGLCRKLGIRAIAEEMSEEALSEKDRVDSIPMRCAKALRLPHRHCDPDRKRRAALGVRQENDIRIEGLLSSPPLAESDIATRVKDSHATRELYWLDRLRELNVWPVLFVCGADHVASFRDLLLRQCVPAEVGACDWVPPNNGSQSDAPHAARA